MTYQQYLRSSSTNVELGEVLQSAPDILLGVGPGAVDVLTRLGVRTVFDLGCSATFGAADEVQTAATDPDSVEARTGDLPSDLFTSQAPALADAPSQDVKTLRAVAAIDGDGLLSESLDVRTIRDMALWPPYRAARAILEEAAGTIPQGAEGPPADLLPMSGRYPTERAHYSTFVLADMDDPTGGQRTALEDTGPLDPASTVAGAGFTKAVRGARLTFQQSWYSQGVALGQLLHSLALAPGESTRVAMIDWSRQQTGTQLEKAGQGEQLVGDMTHKRAMGEVQNAVAGDAQSGFSHSDTQSTATQAGGTAGLSIGPLTAGGSGGYANNTGSATTMTGTAGVRSIAASMNQNIADSTHQAASSARNMFASVVRELSQSEHESVSTRVVANYNHMHALTVQYYEVVQIYRTTVSLHTFEPCLFVPMKPIDFSAAGASGGEAPGSVMVRRCRAALEAAALDAQTRAMLGADAPQGMTVEIRPTVQRVLTPQPIAAPPPDVPADSTDPVGTGTAGPGAPATEPTAAAAAGVSQANWLNTADGNIIEVPEGATLQSVHATFPCRRAGLNFAPGSRENTTYMALNPNVGNDGQPFQSDLGLPVPLGDVTALTLDTNGVQQTGFVSLVLAYRGTALSVDVPVVAFGSTQGEQVMTFYRRDPAAALLARLAEDPLYYSQVVWTAMDSATIALLLAPYTYAGQPLAQVVDPAPIGTTGNYLIFRMPSEARDLLNGTQPATGLGADQTWLAWVGKHADYETKVEDFVPLPSGGVFAEAVLGRANSAEKLDITRFWNWQDSPIPLQAPDIAPITTGSRAQADNTTPTGFASPIVAFNNPPAVPDPAGLSATLGALANGGMFRDMSGSSITEALATAALTGSGAGATSAVSQAAATAAVAAQKEVEMAKVAAGILTGGIASNGGTVSEKGARINEGKSLDDRAASSPAPVGAKEAAPVTGDPTEHETRAAEGEASKAVDLLGSIAGSSSASPTSAAPDPAAPNTGSGTSSTPTPVPAKAPAPSSEPTSGGKPTGH